MVEAQEERARDEMRMLAWQTSYLIKAFSGDDLPPDVLLGEREPDRPEDEEAVSELLGVTLEERVALMQDAQKRKRIEAILNGEDPE